MQREKKREREKTENFRAQFYPTGMSRSAGVFFSLSLFLSFSLVCSQKHPLPTIISCTHPIIQISHLPPFKNSWNAVAINSKRAGPNNHIPTVFERWLIWMIGWGHDINVGRVCFWSEREKKREREKTKHQHSWAFQFNRIVL